MTRKPQTKQQRWLKFSIAFYTLKLAQPKWSVDDIVSDVAKHFKVCKMTIYRAIKANKQ